MRLGIMGPLLVVDDGGGEIRVAAPRQRALLAALLVRANRVVSADELAELVWDGAPPRGAARTLRTYVVRLRQAVGPQVAAHIETRDPGYLCRVTERELDVLGFEAPCRDAGEAARSGRWADAVDAAARALALWRDAPLQDVPGQALRDECAARLEHLRVQALEDRIEAELHLDRHHRLVPELEHWTSVYPLRERLHAQLMLALARAGRQAEALEAYQRARRALVDQLGIEPGPELRALHQRILSGRGAPKLSMPAGSAPSQRANTSAIPRQLPAAPKTFVGRDAELDRLAAIAQDAGAQAGTVLISAIDGMAGIGKSALAVHAAQRLADTFPDGQLFIDLHGYTEGHQPRSADEVLNWLLRSLGVPPQRIPADSEQAAALYRQRLDGTKTLILLDNAVAEAQVRPLLPGAGSCMVLVTSRRRLKALDDAHVMSLDLLSPPDAVALLRAMAGTERIESDDDLLISEIAGLCGHLPLALRIAGALLRHRPAWPLEHLAGRLRDQQQRVAALSDGERELAAVFDLSYANLDARHQRLWRRLGLIPGPEVDAYAAAALLQVEPATAARLLDDLVDHNLLGEHAPGRYRLHDLLRAHAAASGRTGDAATTAENDAALDRLLTYYEHAAARASALIAKLPQRAPSGPAPVHAPMPADAVRAREWLRTERANLQAAFDYAHRHGLAAHLVALGRGLAELLCADGPWPHAATVYITIAAAAEQLADRTAQAEATLYLGLVQYLDADYPSAIRTLTRSLAMFEQSGDRAGQASALTYLGAARQMSGQPDAAAVDLTRALEIAAHVEDSRALANALRYHGQGHFMIGDYAGGLEVYTRLLATSRRTSNLDMQARALSASGTGRYLLGDLDGAADALDEALGIFELLGDLTGRGDVLSTLGTVRQLRGDLPEAADALSQALAMYDQSGNRHGLANALTGLATVHLSASQLPEAHDALTRALRIYEEIGNRHRQANALTYLGTVQRLSGDLSASSETLTRALGIYRDSGNRGNEAWALNHYAATLAAAGERERALAVYQQALAMNRELDKPDDEAASLEGIAEHHLADGDSARCAAHLRQALAIYQRLGMRPDIERVEARLAALGSP